MLNEIKYRVANKDDKACVEKLFIHMLQTIYNTDKVEGYPDNYLDKFFDGSGDIIFVSTLRDEIIGYISVELHHEEEDFVYLDDFVVQKEHRNEGIGSALLDMAESYAKSKGVSKIYLHVEKENLGALKFYDKHKYQKYRLEDSRYRMLKELN